MSKRATLVPNGLSPQIKRILPKSLFGRAILIIILPIAVMQIAVAYFFFNAHWDTVTASLSDSVAADVSVAVELYKQSPGAERAERLDNMLRPNMELAVALEMGESLPTSQRASFFSALDKTLRRALNQSLTDPFWFDTTRYPNHIDIRVQVDDDVLRFIAARERVFAPTGFVFIFWLLTATVLLTLVSIIFIRNQARPIKELSEAADRFGRGQNISGFKPSGASEVRLAGQSFLKMRRRISRHIDQRTVFLAGVSHDLRTPLTRLKLHLALQDVNEETDAAKRDVKDMENMLDGYLDFARGLTGESAVQTSLEPYLKGLVEKYTPAPRLSILGDPVAAIKPVALERAIANLISNAQKFGDKCRVSAEAADQNVLIRVEDDGPGISDDNYVEALKPFSRLDPARNQNIEGVGLGLSITRDIIQSHGGSLRLSRSDMGGLCATIILPV
ncbi:ATP-binding protein [Fretibacter rubidus]|uniref:ATP-binding protein n=1 Tax=Fretibacter rubidus TaxID=570162 RepID=UPI00352B82D3